MLKTPDLYSIMSQSTSPPPPTLNFLSLNPTAPTTTTETLLLIHSGFSSHRDFTFVTPHLPNYHLLIPDLPGHGRSTSHSTPFSPTDAAALLADLIAREARDGKAHVVGVSLGGVVGLYLAAKYPDRVRSVFVTGCGRDLRSSLSAGYFGAFVFAVALPTLVLSVVWLPRWLYEWVYGRLGLVVPKGLQEDQRAAAGYGLGFALARALFSGEFGAEMLGRVRARSLLGAAGKDDDVEGTRWMGGELKKGNGASTAVKVPGMRHVWCLQDGELFARGVEAWVGEGKVLEEFEIL
jgi:pimeloyl-ACP methyl ester carboxylesterase